MYGSVMSNPVDLNGIQRVGFQFQSEGEEIYFAEQMIPDLFLNTPIDQITLKISRINHHGIDFARSHFLNGQLIEETCLIRTFTINLICHESSTWIKFRFHHTIGNASTSQKTMFTNPQPKIIQTLFHRLYSSLIQTYNLHYRPQKSISSPSSLN